MEGATAWRAGRCDFAPFAGDLAQPPDEDVPRERLLAALKSYLNNRDMQADWKSVMTAPAEALVNALAMMCPFDPAEKQALLEAQSFQDRASTLLALLEMGGGSGPTTRELILMLRQVRREDLSSPNGNRSQAAGDPGLPPDQDPAAL